MIVKDDFTRRAWMYFLINKSDAGSASEVFLRVCVLMGSHNWLRLLDLTMEGSFSGGNSHLCAMSF